MLSYKIFVDLSSSVFGIGVYWFYFIGVNWQLSTFPPNIINSHLRTNNINIWLGLNNTALPFLSWFLILKPSLTTYSFGTEVFLSVTVTGITSLLSKLYTVWMLVVRLKLGLLLKFGNENIIIKWRFSTVQTVY